MRRAHAPAARCLISPQRPVRQSRTLLAVAPAACRAAGKERDTSAHMLSRMGACYLIFNLNLVTHRPTDR